MLGSSAHAFVSHVRRGLEGSLDETLLEQQKNAYENSPYNVPQWAGVAVLLTVAFSILCVVSVRYTNWIVISTISMVETPSSTSILIKSEKPLSEKPDALAEDLIEAEVITIKQRAITSNIKNATRFIQSKLGFFGRFRGLSFFAIYHATHALIHMGAMKGLGNLIGDSEFTTSEARFEDSNAMLVDLAVWIAASTFLAPVSTALTHTIISLPGNKRMSERVPSWATIWKSNVIGATIGHAIVKRFTFTLPVMLFGALGMKEIEKITEENVRYVALSLLTVLGVFMMYGFLLLRARVSLVRVQASILPEDVEPIVAFDRSFGQKILKEDGGRGYLTARDAKPDRASTFRIIGMFAKMVLIDIKLHLLAAVAIIGMAYATMGPGLMPFVIASHAQLTGQTLSIPATQQV